MDSVKQAVLDSYPEITSDELIWLMREYARLRAERPEDCARIALPVNREQLRLDITSTEQLAIA